MASLTRIGFSSLFRSSLRTSNSFDQRIRNLCSENERKIEFFTKDDTQALMSIWPDIVREVTFEGRHQSNLPILNNHLNQCVEYNVPKGKKYRGLIVLTTYKFLTDELNRNPVDYKLALILGWCVEFLQGYFLVADDIMDGSETRRGSLCWYKMNGLEAFNDALFLQTCIFTLLKNHFAQRDTYVSLLETFIDVNRRTVLGQSLDMSTSKLDLESFDMNRYNSIVRYKTSYYTLYLPVVLAMQLCGYTDYEILRQVRKILLEIGHFFQVEDDYLDVYGDSKITGKIGTDIQDRKCSWLIVVALERANEQQKKILKESYGYEDSGKIAVVKQIYEDLNLRKIFKSYEEDQYRVIEGMIHQYSEKNKNQKLSQKLFEALLNKIYKREL